MEIAGLIVSFIGALILALITYANSFESRIMDSMIDKLCKTKAAKLGLAILPIGFVLQFLAAIW